MPGHHGDFCPGVHMLPLLPLLHFYPQDAGHSLMFLRKGVHRGQQAVVQGTEGAVIVHWGPVDIHPADAANPLAVPRLSQHNIGQELHEASQLTFGCI